MAIDMKKDWSKFLMWIISILAIVVFVLSFLR